MAGDVRLDVFNILGQRVATLVNGRITAGWHTITFDASHLSSGIYIYRMQADNYVETHTLAIIK